MGHEPDELPDQIGCRIQDTPTEYLNRDQFLEEKYRYGSESRSEPVKAIEKEIDGMARLLRALVTDPETQTSISHLIGLYEQEIANLRELEEVVIEELPERRS